jgi:nucleoside 2-deoxyribosyltransferase
MKRSVYIASPLFNDAERAANRAICTIAERSCDVFLPQRDGHLVTDLIEGGMTPQSAYAFVSARDIEAIDRCDALIINLDGRSVDEGAAFELGFAHARGKICVGYRTDVRVLLQWGLNPMIFAPLVTVVRSLSELEDWLESFVSSEKRAWQSMSTRTQLPDIEPNSKGPNQS